jgi:predicted ArsR family transcriptional regulator
MGEQSQADAVAAIAAIRDPTRRLLFDAVSKSQVAVGRDEAASATGLPRSTAAFHLDRLVEAGLLSVEFERRSGKTGPGAGRPAKFYRRVAAELAVAVPERHYDFIGDLLAAAIEESDSSSEPVRSTLTRLARERGERLGRDASSFDEVLDRAGYEPVAERDGSLVLTNCPFHSLANRHTAIICEANVALLEGAAYATADGCSVHFAPGEGNCCVRVARAST